MEFLDIKIARQRGLEPVEASYLRRAVGPWLEELVCGFVDAEHLDDLGRHLGVGSVDQQVVVFELELDVAALGSRRHGPVVDGDRDVLKDGRLCHQVDTVHVGVGVVQDGKCQNDSSEGGNPKGVPPLLIVLRKHHGQYDGDDDSHDKH